MTTTRQLIRLARLFLAGLVAWLFLPLTVGVTP